MLKTFIASCLMLVGFSRIEATPTSAFWTVCTTDVQETNVPHIDVDNYFRLFHHNRDQSAIWPIDVGLTYGLFNWNDMKAEIGIDYIAPTRDPVYFNAKLGIAEEKLFTYSPGMSLGIFNVGTKTHGQNKTNQNIGDFCISKSLPEAMLIGGRVTAGTFVGNHTMGKNRVGGMVAYDRQFCPAKDASGTEYHKWEFIADYASGKNTIGGGGFATIYYFTPKISIETGPVWFNDQSINGKWKWSIQLDIDI